MKEKLKGFINYRLSRIKRVKLNLSFMKDLIKCVDSKEHSYLVVKSKELL
jgi:hypothetical protein